MSKPVVRISIISIALGLALMIISVAVVIGFKNSVSNKVMGFAAHIQIVPFDNNSSLEGEPVKLSSELIAKLNGLNTIKYIQFTAQKAGLIKTTDQIHGIVLKGVDNNYDSRFLEESLISGKYPDINDSVKTNEVLISKKIADKLNLKINNSLRVWFVDDNKSQARGRKFVVSGIYSTGMEEFDNMYVIGDLRQLQKLNNWNADEVGSIEIILKNIDDIQTTFFELYNTIPYDLTAVTVYSEFPQIFNWLNLLDMNVIVLLTLMIIVATITMISTLLILIIERTNMVGLLKVMGATNASIRKIFIYKASGIIVKGMFLGNFIGLLFYFLQLYFRIIKLDPESYYVDYAPVELSMLYLVLLNAGTFIVSILVLIIPSYYITKIVPAKALRYE